MRTIVALAALVLVAGCATPAPPPESAADEATRVLQPLHDWRLGTAPASPGYAAVGRVEETDGQIGTTQAFEAWTSAGAEKPRISLLRQEKERRKWSRGDSRRSWRY